MDQEISNISNISNISGGHLDRTDQLVSGSQRKEFSERALDPAPPSASPSAPSSAPSSALPLYGAALLSILAALLHLWLMPEHLVESLSYGAFFVGLALVQGLYGVALLRWPSRPVLTLGAWGTLAIVISYAAMRYAQVSFGPHGEHVGSFEVLAMLCSAAELGLLFSLILSRKRLLYTAEALFFGVAFIHLWEAQERFGEWWVFGVFFLAVGLGQGLYCLGLSHFGGRVSFLVGGIVGNLSIAALWVMARTVGIPYIRTTGIESFEVRLGRTEGVGILDLGATTIEVALVVMLVMLAANLYRREMPPNRSATTDLRHSDANQRTTI